MAIPEQKMMGKSTILIVDDDPGVRKVLEHLLAVENYELIFASNGIEALEKATARQPDVILSDVMMPGMDGFELCRHLRADRILGEVPIILITGLDDHNSYIEGLKAGADDFLAKPFDRLKLRARVAAVVRLNRYRRLLEERAKFERLIELSPDGVLLIGADGMIQMANPTTNHMLCVEEGTTLIGRKLAWFVSGPHLMEFIIFFDRVIANPNDIHRTETSFVRMDDSAFPVEISAGHCALQGQSAVQIIVRDITERKAAEERIHRAYEELALACDTSLAGWSRALELRDQNTDGHSQRVAEMTLKLARLMAIPEEQLVHMRRGALLHDIGKMGIPDRILYKPGPLNEEEWVIMRKHPLYAYEMLCSIAYLRPALDIPYYHHEHWDGSGYPHGLQGEEIPLAARLFAVVDVWDALCSNRPYSDEWSTEAVRRAYSVPCGNAARSGGGGDLSKIGGG